jgi:hypothetical protein
MSSATPNAVPEPLDDRDVRALTEFMTTLADVDWIADAAGMYVVVSESGRSYTVDVELEACTCDDAFYRQPADGCKHVRRVEFATGRRSVPDWVHWEAVDDQLGHHL